jgi:hypothetical protein
VTDPRAILERALAPNVVAALDALIEQRAGDIAEQRIARMETAAGKPWLTVREAAAALDCSEVAVRARHKRGRLTGRYHGRRLYISAASVLDLGDRPADADPTTQRAPARRQPLGARPRRKENHP